MLLVPKEAYNSSRLLNIGDSSKTRNNTSVKILELYVISCLFRTQLLFHNSSPLQNSICHPNSPILAVLWYIWIFYEIKLNKSCRLQDWGEILLLQLFDKKIVFAPLMRSNV